MFHYIVVYSYYVLLAYYGTTYKFVRSSSWWEYIVLETFTPTDWFENFRVSRQTFQYLCQKLGPLIRCQNTQLRKCVSVEKRVAITLWCLATCSEYRATCSLVWFGSKYSLCDCS